MEILLFGLSRRDWGFRHPDTKLLQFLFPTVLPLFLLLYIGCSIPHDIQPREAIREGDISDNNNNNLQSTQKRGDTLLLNKTR